MPHFRISREILGAGKEPGINLGVNGAQIRLQTRRVPFRVIHEKSGIDTEEASQQVARRVRQMRTKSAFNLRQVRLAQAAADFALHSLGDFQLSHRTTQATKRAFDGAEGAKFVAESHEAHPNYI